jgi:threonine/homoserine efflux transporter RhtA
VLLAYVVQGAVLVPLVVSALCGTVIPFVVDLVTKSHAPTVLKGGIAAILSALAGALTTVALSPNETWPEYGMAIFMAFVATISVHSTGVTDGVQRKTARKGIGGKATRKSAIPPLSGTRVTTASTRGHVRKVDGPDA